ncbi:MAG TPA: peptidase [Chloroflexaceae bacterium]|nr:peptidase [Chloroflexaceae bacterium]
MINRRTHLRNAAVAALVVCAILAFFGPLTQTPALAQQAITISPPTPQISLPPGGTGQTSVTISNNNIPNAVDRTFSIAFSNVPAGLTIPNPGTAFIAVGSSQQFTINAQATTAVAPGVYNVTGTVTGSGAGGQGAISQGFTLQVTVTGPTFTPSPTNTATTGPATITPTRGPVCRDGFEGDDDPGGAKVIDVNTAQERAICPAGDVDWLVFGGVQGKVYTIDISRMDPGIDLTLELFDENLNSLAFNDDFFLRDPANPNPGDIRPRITTRIPADGRYYIRVRDAAGRGGVNYIYVIALLDESYGPTPTLVREICLDLFEPDGLPEQARLLTSNEIQEERRLCPAGDADWVTFFAKAGKRYIIYTDTRRYRGRNVVNGETQAGADTTMILTDRDGVSLIDANDDIPGGSTLDSQIEFTPSVDGFYFAQIKNVGDIGNQFVRYDLVLLLCVPGQTDCGRADVPGTPVVPITPLPTGTPDAEFNLDPTSTPRPTTQP